MLDNQYSVLISAINNNSNDKEVVLRLIMIFNFQLFVHSEYIEIEWDKIKKT